MDFKGFYDEIIFDVDRSILKSYTGKQGDTKSRGLYVTVTQKNAVIDDLTGLSMRLFYEKPDKTRGFIDGVVDGNKFRIDYTNQMYAVPGVVKAELRLMGADGEIITAKTFKILVDSSIADGSIVSENERGILDRAFELAEDIIPRLELLDVELLEEVQDEMLGARHSNTKDETYDSLGQRLDAIEQDLLDHKAEYTSNRQQDQLKIAKVEKELNDYKATMQQINIHQSPTQKASGHGIVSLPPNAAEGQVSVTLFGNTEVDEEGNTKSTISAVRIKSVGKNLFNPYSNNMTTTGNPNITRLPDGIQIISTSNNKWTLVDFKNIKLKPNTTYYLNYNAEVIGSGFNFVYVYYAGTTTIIRTLKGSFISPADGLIDIQFYGTTNTVSAGSGMKYTNIQLEEGSIATPYEPYRESNAYVVAVDKDTGKILELRSLLNGTKDEVRVSDNKCIKKVGISKPFSEVAWLRDADADTANYYGLVIGYSALEYYGSYLFETPHQIIGDIYYEPKATGALYRESDTLCYRLNSSTHLHLKIPKSVFPNGWSLEESQAWFEQNQVQLIYQLAEPVEIPIQVSGSIASYPSGTIYIERILPDAGVYTDKISVLHQDAPIKRLDKLSKVDFMTGVETELDISQAEISEDKLSFTHPELSAGDIVFFEYEYDIESTEGETEVEFYDSRYVVKDDVTGKFYKWNVKVSNGTPTIEVVEV